MPKLSNLKPSLSTLPPRLGYAPGDEKARDKQRAQTQHWRAWYKTARWQKLRWSILVRDLFTCQRCKRVASGKGEAHVDHIRPHRGNETLFWSADNLQCLCAPCHNSAKQSEERKHG
ncbi:MAG TPA: HNH endonuclease signature motif containing protein [Rhizobiaceae bacterium]|nr:HNH endonuclease signature motif containing protein [Rhizobiaceae bacterium]